MTFLRDERRTLGLRRSASVLGKAVIQRAEEIRQLKGSGREAEALEAEHEALDQMLGALHQSVVSGASRAECIDILDSVIDFCASHFRTEETLMGHLSPAQFHAHAEAHKEILANMVKVRRRAVGTGLTLAGMDTVDLLHDFHEHVRTYDRRAAIISEKRS
jgi:hemerythrin-like metal-binding protein